MPTLWQMLTKKKEEEEPETSVEFQFDNPLGVKVGNFFTLDTIDSSNFNFRTVRIREVARIIEDEEHKFVDYDITAHEDDGNIIKKRVRLVPLEDSDEELKHHVLVLDLLDEFGYHEEFHDGLAFEQNNGEFVEGEETYWRVNDLQEPWEARTTFLEDLDKDGTVQEEEIKHGELTYWDFWREVGSGTDEESDSEVLEFLIVEMDGNGYFEIWLGREMNPNRISVSTG